MVLHLHKNCLNLLQNEKVNRYILNTKYKVWQIKEIPIVQVIVCI